MKTSSEPYDFDSSLAVSGVLPHGAGRGELDPGDLVAPPLALEAGQHPLGALEHGLRGLRLGGLGAHLVGLVGERLGLVLGVGPLALAALLVGLALGEVRLQPTL